MANRSYLYTYLPDKIPPYQDLSEWKLNVPLSYLLLVSINVQPCTSALWPHLSIAIRGDAATANDRLAEKVLQVAYWRLEDMKNP